MNDEQTYTVIDGRGAMSVFEIYIKTTPERLWEAITDREPGASTRSASASSPSGRAGPATGPRTARRGSRSPRARTSRSTRRAGWCRASPRCGATRCAPRAPRG